MGFLDNKMLMLKGIIVLWTFNFFLIALLALHYLGLIAFVA